MGSKSLLKAVLTKSTVTMAARRLPSKSKSLAIYVYGLAHQYRQANSAFDISQMNAFMDAIKEISGDQSGLVSGDVSGTDVRSLLETTIPLFLSILQDERPANFAKLKDIDWRSLFAIEPDPPVDIIIAPASDDDSGTGTSLST